MNYDLALELKNAGFPQMEEIGNGVWYSPKTIIRRTGITPGEVIRIKSDYAYAPTLSELIDDIGEVILFYSDGDTTRETGWYAGKGKLSLTEGFIPESFNGYLRYGKDKDTAMANLWLTIHKK